MIKEDKLYLNKMFLQLSTDVAVIKAQMANHLHHHELATAKLSKWLIAICTLLGGLVGNTILRWII